MKGKKDTGSERKKKAENCEVERRKIFKELLTHIEAGYSINCFPAISETTIDKWMKLYSKEFNEEDLQAAIRKGQAGWEIIGRRQSTGECLGNSRSWFYNMAHRYKWSDKVDVSLEHKGQVNISVVNYGDATSSQTYQGGQ
jgi:hypothetical protein